MNTNDLHAGAAGNKTRIAQAERRTEQAERRTEQAEARTDEDGNAHGGGQEPDRIGGDAHGAGRKPDRIGEDAHGSGRIRAERAETRTAQAETFLQRLVQHEIVLPPAISPRPLKRLPLNVTADQKSPFQQLTSRQRGILQLTAKARPPSKSTASWRLTPRRWNTTSKKLMDGLNIHDVPGLVRFALRAGLIPQEV